MYSYLPLLFCAVCTGRVQDLAAVMICRCRTVSVKTQLWSPLMRSENKPWVHEIAQVSQQSSRVIVMPMLILLWVTRRERGGGGSRKMERKEQKWRGGGGEREMNPTFQMRTIIKLIAWQGESRITTLHWQTCGIISRVPSVSSCSEQPCLPE